MLSIYQRERLDRAALRARQKREYNGALRPSDNGRRINIRRSPIVRRLLGAIVVLVLVLVIVLASMTWHRRPAAKLRWKQNSDAWMRP